MPKTIQKEKRSTRRGTTPEVEQEVADTTERDAKLKELDALLDEVDEVLEENAEAFVRSYVQKGGE